MTLAIDTDVLVSWAMHGAPHHRAARDFVRCEIESRDTAFGFTSQVLFEFLHVVTDARRFERPMPMQQALALTRALWDAPETVRVAPGPAVPHRTMELLDTLRLGRKRILDTALAATLESSGITRIATFNGSDFTAFAFLEVVDPRGTA